MGPSNSSNNIFTLNLISAALYYTRIGWKVFPCQPKGKKPILKHWPTKASLDKNQIIEWWEQWPNANIAILTGIEIEVLDVDYKNEGADSMRYIRDNFTFPTTPTVETGNGCHHYFSNTGVEIRNKVNILPGIDWRGKGGYVIAPPSIHPNGEQYVWSIEP